MPERAFVCFLCGWSRRFDLNDPAGKTASADHAASCNQGGCVQSGDGCIAHDGQHSFCVAHSQCIAYCKQGMAAAKVCDMTPGPGHVVGCPSDPKGYSHRRL